MTEGLIAVVIAQSAVIAALACFVVWRVTRRPADTAMLERILDMNQGVIDRLLERRDVAPDLRPEKGRVARGVPVGQPSEVPDIPAKF